MVVVVVEVHACSVTVHRYLLETHTCYAAAVETSTVPERNSDVEEIVNLLTFSVIFYTSL